MIHKITTRLSHCYIRMKECALLSGTSGVLSAAEACMFNKVENYSKWDKT